MKITPIRHPKSTIIEVRERLYSRFDEVKGWLSKDNKFYSRENWYELTPEKVSILSKCRIINNGTILEQTTIGKGFAFKLPNPCTWEFCYAYDIPWNILEAEVKKKLKKYRIKTVKILTKAE